MSEDIPQNGGVVVMFNNLPLGFGVTSKSTENLQKSLPDDVAVFHQVRTRRRYYAQLTG